MSSSNPRRTESIGLARAKCIPQYYPVRRSAIGSVSARLRGDVFGDDPAELVQCGIHRQRELLDAAAHRDASSVQFRGHCLAAVQLYGTDVSSSAAPAARMHQQRSGEHEVIDEPVVDRTIEVAEPLVEAGRRHDGDATRDSNPAVDRLDLGARPCDLRHAAQRCRMYVRQGGRSRAGCRRSAAGWCRGACSPAGTSSRHDEHHEARIAHLARSAGLNVAVRGRFRPEVWAAYEQAHAATT